MRTVFTKGDLDKLKAEHKIQTPARDDPPTDDGLSAISKFIPSEAVFIFLGAFGLFRGALETTPVEWLGVGVFIFCLIVATFLAYHKASTEEIRFPGRKDSFKVPRKWIKVMITAVAFVIWAVNIEGFVEIIRGALPGYDPIIGGLFLLGYTTLVPIVYAEMSKPKLESKD